MALKKDISRRNFVKTGAVTGLGFSLNLIPSFMWANHQPVAKGKRIGIIGLDTSHSIAFTKELHDAVKTDTFSGYQVVAAYPYGSRDIELSIERIPKYTEEIKKYGVEIAGSISQLLTKVDFVLLETNDGRLHLDQALQVIKAGKPLFIDKPVAASLTHAAAIFKAAQKYRVPVFSSSSLRYMSNVQDIIKGKYGKVNGADTYSLATLEKTHPDLYWYGIHGVETLFSVMGPGCKSVVRYFTDETDVVVGTWNDGRIGTFRGIRSGKTDFGGTCYCEKGIVSLGPYAGYTPLLYQIIEFFKSGEPPVKASETLEILAFMDAADESKKNGSAAIAIEDMFKKAGVENKQL